MNTIADARLDTALQSITAGRPVLVVDGHTTEVVMSAQLADTRWTAWAVRHTSGLLCAALPASRADELGIPAMIAGDRYRVGTASFGVAVDAAEEVGTGISASDRARTARMLACPTSRPSDLTRPGHVMTIRTAEGGTVECIAVSEAAVDLCRIGGLAPVALTATLLEDNGTNIEPAERMSFARSHRVPIIDVRDVAHHRLHHGDGHRERVRRAAARTVDTPTGTMHVIDFDDELTGASHFACIGAGVDGTPAVHVITEPSHHDPFISHTPVQQDFQKQLSRIASDGGVIVYLRSRLYSERRFAVPEDVLMQGAAAAILANIRRPDTVVSELPDNRGRSVLFVADGTSMPDSASIYSLISR